jgi:hypothetical protein
MRLGFFSVNYIKGYTLRQPANQHATPIHARLSSIVSNLSKLPTSDLIYFAAAVIFVIKDKVLGSLVKNSIHRYDRCALTNGFIIDAAFGFKQLKLPVTELISLPRLTLATMYQSLLNPHPSSDRLAQRRINLDPRVTPTEQATAFAKLPDFFLCAQRITCVYLFFL